MDAESVVNCILGKLKIAEIDFIIADCLDILFRLFNVSVVYAKRSKNNAAHSLVGIARNLGSLLWFGNVPEPDSSIVFSELIIGNE